MEASKMNIPAIRTPHFDVPHKPRQILLKNLDVYGSPGSAYAVAMARFNNRTIGSPHYILDNEKTYSCVPLNMATLVESDIEKGVVVVELCGRSTLDESEWLVYNHDTIRRAAELCAFLGYANRIPFKECPKPSKRGFKFDIYGAFPTEYFLRLVHEANHNNIDTVRNESWSDLEKQL